MFRKNVDSGVKVPANIWDKVGGRLTYLATPYTNVPIYLVNPSTMDKIRPPEMGYNPECVKRSMKDVREVIKREREMEKLREWKTGERAVVREPEVDAVERTWQILSECKGMTYPTVGVYTEDSPTIREYTSEKETRAIFICPERIYNSNHSKPDIMFQFVVIHELAHAYHGMCMYYSNDWGKVIEESLANAVAYAHFKKKEKNAILEHISQQPCEYKGYTFWSPDSEPMALQVHLQLWKMLFPVPYPSTRSGYHEFLQHFYRDYLERTIWKCYGIWAMDFNDFHKLFGPNANPELFYKFLAVEILREGTA